MYFFKFFKVSEKYVMKAFFYFKGALVFYKSLPLFDCYEIGAIIPSYWSE